jgi:transcriptional regulator of acetoin/glycerol metabolism
VEDGGQARNAQVPFRPIPQVFGEDLFLGLSAVDLVLPALRHRVVEAREPGEPRDEILPRVQVEESHIRRALAASLPLEETARRLGIDPSPLWRKRKRYGV